MVDASDGLGPSVIPARDRVFSVASLGLLALAPLIGGCSRTSSGTTVSPCIEITTTSGVEMLLVPGGSFLMGSDQGEPDERPVHEVALRGFAMDKHEVTQDQFARLELPNPSQFKGPRNPVEQVRWSDAAEFCNARSVAEGLEPCYDERTFACDFEASGYRLPTEAEWEYACRASSHEPLAPPSGSASSIEVRSSAEWGFNGGAEKLRNHACYAGNAGRGTDPVGRKKPNRWGFLDLHGNVAEWVHDVYDPGYYAASPRVDPRGPAAGKERVLRGGSWRADAESCRPSRRLHDVPGITDACFAQNTYGFRCVRRLTQEEEAMLEERSSLGAVEK